MAVHGGNFMAMNEDSDGEMRGVLREMADFIALYEAIEEKLIAREIALEGKLITGEKILADQLTRIKNNLSSFQGIMTEAGAARWRVAAENALREGSDHLRVMRETSLEIEESVAEGCSQLEQLTQQSTARIIEAAGTFQPADFQNAATQGCERIKEMSFLNVKRITKLIKAFHWKSVFVSFMLTLFIVFLTGLYVNDEWPWEIHSEAAKERNAGRTLLAAWPNLNPTQQQEIVTASKRTVSF